MRVGSKTGSEGARKPVGKISDRLMRGAVWIVAARVVTVGALMAHTVVLAQLLGPAAFGLAAIATTVAAIVEIATKQSLTSALVQTDNVTRDHIDTAFTLNLVRGAIIGTAIFLLAWPVAALYNEERVVPMLLALGVSTSIFGISNPKLYVLSRDLQFWQEFARVACERAAVLAVSIPIAYFFRTPWAIIAGVAAGQISLVVSSFFFVPYRPRLCLKRTRELLSFSIWVSLSQLLQGFVMRMDQLLVGYFLGNSALGILAVSSRLADAPKESVMPILGTAFPGFAKLRSDIDQLRPAYQRVQAMIFLVHFPLAIGLALVAEPVVMLFLGEQWADGILVIQLLAGATGLQAMASAVNPLAMSQGMTRTLFFRTLLNTGLRVPMVIGGLLAYGLVGLLIARILHSFTSVSVNMNLVRKILGLSIVDQLSANARTIIATIAMVLALLGFDLLYAGDASTTAMVIELTAKVALGGAVFVLVLFALWFVAKRPVGPEQEIVKLLTSVKDRAFKKTVVSPADTL